MTTTAEVIEERLSATLQFRVAEYPVCQSAEGELQTLTGFPASAWLSGSCTLQQLVHPEDKDTLERFLAVGATGEPCEQTVRLVHASDDSVKVLRCVAKQFLDAGSGHRLQLQFFNPQGIHCDIFEEAVSRNFRSMLESTDDFIYFKNLDHVFTAASQTMVSVTSCTEHWRDFVGKTDYEVFPREYADIYFTLEKQIFSGEIEVGHAIQPVKANNGRTGWVDNRKYPIRDASGEIIGLFGVARDITELHASMEELRASQALNRIANRIARMGAWYVDLPDNSLYWSEEVYRIFEVPVDTKITVEQAISHYAEPTRHRIEQAVTRCIESAAPFDLTLKVITGTGRVIWTRSAGEALRNSEGVVTRIHGTVQDITRIRESEEKIQNLAHYDQLTGLPNRALLNERMEYAIRMAERRKEKMTVMFLDLDLFKNVNDSLGHDVGDQLLIRVGRRLTGLLRDVDTVARMGGDEFVLVLPATDAEGAANVAGNIKGELSRPYRIDGQDLHTTPSIGIVVYPEDGDRTETLLRHADAAMYQVKHSTRNDYRFFTRSIQRRIVRNVQIGNALSDALGAGQLELHFQPQWASSGMQLIGAEALLRWTHPTMGRVLPGEFIPVAEHSGRILRLGEWVLRQSLMQLRQWREAGHSSMRISVNLSAAQFRDKRLPERISEILKEQGLGGDVLELELTEAVAMDDPQAAMVMMERLAQLGVRLAIDDFGTGYSSLSRLKQFNVHRLKIDRSFVGDITTDSSDRAIVAAIISMADDLGIRTLAEGVESTEQLTYLRERGCNEVQGFLLGKPVPAEEFSIYFKDESD